MCAHRGWNIWFGHKIVYKIVFYFSIPLIFFYINIKMLLHIHYTHIWKSISNIHTEKRRIIWQCLYVIKGSILGYYYLPVVRLSFSLSKRKLYYRYIDFIELSPFLILYLDTYIKESIFFSKWDECYAIYKYTPT